MNLYENITQEAFGLAIELSSKVLETMNTENLCKNTGATYIDNNTILLNYLNRPYLINIRSGQISLKEDEKENIPLKDKILIFHYLTQAKGTSFTNRLISYAQIQGGRFYCSVFQKRTLEPIIRCFGKEPEKLLEICQTFYNLMARR